MPGRVYKNILPGFFVPARQWLHAPAQPQPPGLAAAAGHEASFAQLPQPFDCDAMMGGANDESCLLSFFAPQDGHFAGLSESVRARCSNAWPQAEQAYS